jgi:hypothetical protein
MSSYSLPSKEEYRQWLYKEIWSLDVEPEQRRCVIIEFFESLTKLMKKNGYVMDKRWKWKEVAFWMFRLHIQERVRLQFNKPVYLPEIIHRNTEEDYEYYETYMTSEIIDNFLEPWKRIDDMDVDTRVGYRLRYGLSEFLYTFVNLENSKSGQIVAKRWEDSGSDSDYDNGNRNYDSYLQDARDGYHGGRGFKV